MKIESNDTTAPVRKVRRTPTEKQVELLVQLNDDALIATAVEALHSLNRRAKKIRDQKNRYRRATFAKALADDMVNIYSLKDRFLEALVLDGRASVGTFEIDKSRFDEPCQHYCEACGRSWVGDDWCYACQDDSGTAIPETWYVIDCGDGHRFHQPDMSETVAAKAVPIPPHDPTQPERDIPLVELSVDRNGEGVPTSGKGATRLTIQAQRRCVEMATARLRPSTTATGTALPTASPSWAAAAS